MELQESSGLEEFRVGEEEDGLGCEEQTPVLKSLPLIGFSREAWRLMP